MRKGWILAAHLLFSVICLMTAYKIVSFSSEGGMKKGLDLKDNINTREELKKEYIDHFRYLDIDLHIILPKSDSR
ncbi:hypothetical protein [Ammoniphilus sp. 3BR4]|uniref:hypothetical protein n=1 Tax=Ammoniphilus sp. 3BR4 TaxID=3158265 RepID=UPI003467567C